MLQLLGKAHGSQDLLNPNPLRHQVCLNSSKSYLIIQAQQQRRRGVVAGSPQSKNQRGFDPKMLRGINHPCLGCDTGFIPT